jgi:hypothetical protein
MSTYQKDWFAPQKHGERNHYPNKKYNNTGKINENNNNNYARSNESKKRLSPAPNSLDGTAPAINEVQCPTFTNVTKEINGKKEEQSTKYAGSGGASILNMYKMQNASRLYNSSYSNNNNANNNNNNNNSHNPANKIHKSSLDSASTKTGDTVVNGSKKTANNENGHYYPHHSHNYHYSNNNSSQRKKFFAKSSNKSGNLTPSTSVHQNNKQPTSKHASSGTTTTSAETIDFTTSELFPALSEAMAQTKKQVSPPLSTPVVSATANQASHKTSPVKAKPSQQTYSKEFLYYVGMQMANRLVNQPPIQARTAASNLLHSNLLAHATNYNLQTEVTKSRLLEQAMEKSVVAAAAAAVANKEALNNYASFNYLLPHIHDRDYDAYENSMKGQRMISKQQEDCFYQNNYHFQHAGSSNNMHYNGNNNNNNRAGYQNNHSKKQYSYNGSYSGNSKNKGPPSSYSQNNNNSKCPNHNTQNRQANGQTTGKFGHLAL